MASLCFTFSGVTVEGSNSNSNYGNYGNYGNYFITVTVEYSNSGKTFCHERDWAKVARRWTVCDA